MCLVHVKLICYHDNSLYRLDSCLQDILRSTNSLPGNKDWSSPQDAINHMLNTNILEKDSCYDPEPDDINTILNHIVNMNCQIYNVIIIWYLPSTFFIKNYGVKFINFLRQCNHLRK